MGRVSIDDIAAGMIVAEDVRTTTGVPLVSRGLVLAEAHIRALRAFGVRALEIADAAAGPDPEPDVLAEAEAAWRTLLRPRFQAHDLNAPPGETLWRLAAARAARRALSEKLSREALQERAAVVCPAPERSLFGQEDFDPALLVSGEVELATLPEIHIQLLSALTSPASTSKSLASIIRHDPSLAAKLLRLVNSPFYGAAAPIDTIGRAVSMVGLKELTTLILGLAACQAFADINPELFDMRAFWRHAAACGVYAASFAAVCPGAAPDRVFVGGLLHDLGQLVILRKLPAAAGRALLLSRLEGLPLAEAETAVLGFDHAAVGRALLAGWHFPEALTAMVAGHHEPSDRPEDREAALVHLADIVATAMAWPALGGPQVPPLAGAAWRSLDISPGVLAEVVENSETRIRDIEAVFLDDARPPTQ